MYTTVHIMHLGMYTRVYIMQLGVMRLICNKWTKSYNIYRET